MAEFKLTLIQRKDIKTNEEKVAEQIAEINSSTGRSDWTWEVEWQPMVELIKAESGATSSYLDQIGSNAANALENLASNIKKLCEDEMSKEAFNESASTGKIVCKFNNKAKDFYYHQCKFDNGDLVLTFKSICNFSSIGQDIERLL